MYAACRVYREIGHTLANTLLEYGAHIESCNYWEIRLSGRLLDIPESEVCSCGWTTCKEQILDAQKRGEDNPLTEEEINAVLGKYLG